MIWHASVPSRFRVQVSQETQEPPSCSSRLRRGYNEAPHGARRFYLGWFPLGRPGTDGEGWKIAVTGTANVRGYQLSFDTETPADIVAAAVARVLETSRRV
ncbi:DUF317 domain-containing protein [Streptomyces sp. NPDC021356]|uniref:DUF317 domain-containing protein n=1 Tax=Streptomyces sp. NPDC021356 TaxID=3154900 RepID=UPI00340B5C6F